MSGQAVFLVVWLLLVAWSVWWCLSALMEANREARELDRFRARERHPAGRRRKDPNDLAPWDRL